MSDQIEFTIVCPIHNEANMLPKTLQSIYNLKPAEVIFCLDRCTDNTSNIIKLYAERYAKSTFTNIREYRDCDGAGWRFRGAYLRRDAYQHAKNDIILNTSADIRLDINIAKYLKFIPYPYRLISFGYLEYPWNIQQFLRIVISELTPIHGLSGLLAVSKEAWLKTEDIEDLKKIPRNEDTHLQLAIDNQYATLHINTKSLHLRPNETKIDHYYRGYSQWTLQHKLEFSAFIHSLIMVRPATYIGYRHAKKMEKNEKINYL